MALSYGEIDSLQRIRSELDRHGVNRFSSVVEIERFRKEYKTEREQIEPRCVWNVDSEIDLAASQVSEFEQSLHQSSANRSVQLIAVRDKWSSEAESRLLESSGSFYSYLIQVKGRVLRFFSKVLETQHERFVFLLTASHSFRLWRIKRRHEGLIKSRVRRISDLIEVEMKELERIKNLVDSLVPLITGAKGEFLVASELGKLPDSFTVFNGFSMTFKDPIISRTQNYRIHSVQIDHLVVGPSGIFIIETKNWRQSSIENIDLRSPVEQVKRYGFAMHCLLHDRQGFKTLLNTHHWGKKKIPIRNVLAMAGYNPEGAFEFVTIKSVNELNRYIEYFNPVLTDDEASRICEFLKEMQG